MSKRFGVTSIVAGVMSLLAACDAPAPSASSAAAEPTSRHWRSPDGVIEVTLPEGWRTEQAPEPAVMLFVISPDDSPATSLCAVDRHVSLSPPMAQDEANKLIEDGWEGFVRPQRDPISSMETVDGVLIGSYEADASDGSKHKRRFSRVLQIPQGANLTRYSIFCEVSTPRPGGESDYQATRNFASSLKVNSPAR